MSYVFTCNCGHELTIHTDMKVKKFIKCRKCKSIMTTTRCPE